ncbi:rplA [Symbiodinium sp. CCMP2456]|nr:rplA [Symbiodinium sp. CCMP2456]
MASAKVSCSRERGTPLALQEVSSMAAFVIQGGPLLRELPETQVGKLGSLVTSRSIAKFPVQENSLDSSSTCVCLVAAFVGAALLARRFSLSRPRGVRAFWSGSQHLSRSATCLHARKRKRHAFWYNEDLSKAPRWLPGWKEEKLKQTDDDDDEEEQKEDAFPEGRTPTESLPKFMTYEFWKKMPGGLRCRSPRYWKMYFNEDGTAPKYDRFKYHSLAEAIDIIFSFYESAPNDAHDSSLEIAMFMALDAKYPDQQIRMKVKLPNGAGKQKRVAVFCPPAEEEEALESGATIAGKTLQDELVAEEFNFDVLIAKPAMMPALAKLGKILGPRKLMPSPKSGTLVTDIKTGIEAWASGGTVELRNNDNMFIGCPFAKISQGKEKCLENLRGLLQQLADNAPPGAKKREEYFARMFVKGDDSPSVRIDPKEFPDHGLHTYWDISSYCAPDTSHHDQGYEKPVTGSRRLSIGRPLADYEVYRSYGLEACLCTAYGSILHETLALQLRLLAMDLDPILTHAESGDLDAMKAVLADSDSVNKRLKLRDADKRTALHRACAAGHEQIVAHLLSHRANPNVEDEEEWTPLHSAASRGSASVATLLTEAGADCDATTSSGTSALHYAASKGHDEVIRILIGAGAKVNSKDRSGGFPLLRAAGAGRLQALKILLEAQADLRCKDKSGDNAFHVAINGHHTAICEILFDRDEAEKLMKQENEDGKTAAQMLLDLAPAETRDKIKSIWREKKGG